MTASTAVLEHREDAQRRSAPGRLVVEHLPQLARHTGSPPDLVLRWNSVPARARVDVVIHLHGYSARGRALHLVRDKLPISGLDLSARRTPTLAVLPRGHFFGGGSGRGFSFPALRRRGGVVALADEALRRFNAATGAGATRGRLIVTAHSGGGAALMHILTELDPDEVHTFDALYTDPGPLIAWARRMAAAGRDGAMRVLYRAGEGTAANSLRVARAVPRSARFRVERTTVPHNDIPATYGGRLLADPSADLPGAVPAIGAATQRELGTLPPGGPGAEALSERIARVARAEFRRWRPGGGAALTETSPAASPILREYYRIGVGVAVTDAQMQNSSYPGGSPVERGVHLVRDADRGGRGAVRVLAGAPDLHPGGAPQPAEAASSQPVLGVPGDRGRAPHRRPGLQRPGRTVAPPTTTSAAHRPGRRIATW